MPAPAMSEEMPARYTDPDPAWLAAEEGVMRTAREMLIGAWSAYLRRVLPPLPAGHPEQDALQTNSPASL